MSIEERDELGDYIVCRGQVYTGISPKQGMFVGTRLCYSTSQEVFRFLFREHNKSWQFATQEEVDAKISTLKFANSCLKPMAGGTGSGVDKGLKTSGADPESPFISGNW